MVNIVYAQYPRENQRNTLPFHWASLWGEEGASPLSHGSGAMVHDMTEPMSVTHVHSGLRASYKTPLDILRKLLKLEPRYTNFKKVVWAQCWSWLSVGVSNMLVAWKSNYLVSLLLRGSERDACCCGCCRGAPPWMENGTGRSQGFFLDLAWYRLTFCK